MLRSKKQEPIGIFDSGIGGLTVAKAVMQALPKEDIIYFGDTARVPYGDKSKETVKQYSLEITDFLLSKEVKMILIACNTVSASAKEDIKQKAGDIPVLDVITAGTKAVLEANPHQNVGVIGTLATVNSGAYIKSIQKKAPHIEVLQQACPLLVPLAEEGWIDNDIAKETLKIYLDNFAGTDIKSLILGCTHYPLFKQQIRTILSTDIKIIDSAESIAKEAKRLLETNNLLNENGGTFNCYVSDRPQRFKEVAERFLGRPIQNTSVVKL